MPFVELTVLRRIRCVTRRDRRKNVDIRKELGVTRDVVNEVRHRRLSYFGHVVCMLPSRVPNLLLYSRVEGTRPRGWPKKRWLDGLREDFKIAGITERDAECMTRDRRLGVALSIGCWSALTSSLCRRRRRIKSSQVSHINIYIYIYIYM